MEEAKKLLKEALQQGSGKFQRRRETARMLNSIGAGLCYMEQTDWATRFLGAARARQATWTIWTLPL